MVSVPCPQAKFSLRLNPQSWSDGRIAVSLVRRGADRTTQPQPGPASLYRPGNQVAQSGDGEESGGGVVGGQFIIQIQCERESASSPADSPSTHLGSTTLQ